MENDLQEMWSRFSLTEEEGKMATVTNAVVRAKEEKVRHGLVGKLLNRKPVNREAFKSFIKQMWKIEKGFSILEVSDDVFLFNFPNDFEWKKVMKTGPWNFDRAL